MLGVPGDIRFGHFQNGIDLVSGDGWKVFEKLLNRIASLEMVEKRSDGNARAGETGQAALDFRVDCYRVHTRDFIIIAVKGHGGTD